MDLAIHDVHLLIFVSYTDMVFQKLYLLSEARPITSHGNDYVSNPVEEIIHRLKITAPNARTDG